MASISHRVSIRWLPAEPSEPTPTLVLTSPEGRFVDLRLTSATSLYWGFSGQSIKQGDPPVGRWIHEIDSRSDAVVEDSGTFEILPDGNALERGRMKDFDDGVEKEYEEVWNDQEILPKRCFVVDIDSRDESAALGRMVVLGNWMQVIVKSRAGGISAQKWELVNGQWEWRFGCGQESMPIPEHFESLVKGATLHRAGHAWVLVETSTWQ